jgi:hypothetical protein
VHPYAKGGSFKSGQLMVVPEMMGFEIKNAQQISLSK